MRERIEEEKEEESGELPPISLSDARREHETKIVGLDEVLEREGLI